jgi:hypothetical protein
METIKIKVTKSFETEQEIQLPAYRKTIQGRFFKIVSLTECYEVEISDIGAEARIWTADSVINGFFERYDSTAEEFQNACQKCKQKFAEKMFQFIEPEYEVKYIASAPATVTE